MLICSGCGKESGSGTLLDEFPEPPKTGTTIHRLYLAFTLFTEDVEEIVNHTGPFVITQEAWERFARQYKCLICKHGLVGSELEHDHPLGVACSEECPVYRNAGG